MPESYTAGVAPDARGRRWHYLLVVLIFVLSLFLRLSDLDLFLGGDESKWICRSINFHNAIVERRWADTYQSEHPGVVTMWIGTLALSLDQAGDWVYWCQEMGGDKLTRVDNQDTLLALPSHIARARRLLTSIVWASVIAIYVLVRRLWGWEASFWAALLLALDPFYLALSRVMHLDAVLSTFMLLSACALLVYLLRGRQRRYLVLSALAGGLAIANKTPGLFVGGWAILMALGLAWTGEKRLRVERLKQAVADLAIWGGLALSLVVLLWPALWVAPVASLGKVFGAALGYAETAHGNSNYFWHAIRPDPGPAFYPVAWVFRATPLVVLGLIGLASPKRKPFEQRGLLALVGFAGLFLLFMTAGAKKFDRYGLPAFVVIDLIAAYGMACVAAWCRERLDWPRWTASLAKSLLLAVHLTLVAAAFPYGFSYYNPLVGGAQAAQDILLMGWGEGMEQAAAYLNAKPHAEQFHVNTAHISQFAPFFVGHTSSASDLDLAESDYYVFYVNTIQRLREPEVLMRFYGQVEPEHIVSANGIDYVYIYRNHLLDPLTDYLQSEADPLNDLVLLDISSALLRQDTGTAEIVQIDGMAGRDALVTQLNSLVRDRQRLLYVTFPETPGDPRGVISDLLGACADAGEPVIWDGIQVTPYTVRQGCVLSAPAPESGVEARYDEAIDLRGYDLTADDAGLTLRLYWRAVEPVGSSYTVFVHVLDDTGALVAQHDGLPVGGAMPTNSWVVDETVIDEHRLTWPDSQSAKRAVAIACGLYDASTGQRLGVVDGDGNISNEQRVMLVQDLAERVSRGE